MEKYDELIKKIARIKALILLRESVFRAYTNNTFGIKITVAICDTLFTNQNIINHALIPTIDYEDYKDIIDLIDSKIEILQKNE
jgi:hypothetical protein